MRFAQKLICLLLLVLSASFGVGGCYLLYSDFAAQRQRVDHANAAAETIAHDRSYPAAAETLRRCYALALEEGSRP